MKPMEIKPLKPCPFCGGGAEISVNPDTLRCIAYCPKCAVTMKRNFKGNEKIEVFLIELMKEEWNKRAEVQG